MKTFNISFAVLLLSCLLLSFIAPNNLSNSENNTKKPVLENLVFHQNNPAPEADTLSFEALNRFITDELIRPVEFCFEKKDPHMFMTKCYSRIYFQLTNSDKNRMLYKDYDIRGSIIFNNCNQESRMADIVVNYSMKTISVRESYRGGSQDYKDYLKDICEYINKNGIPE
jgi:hypothetical protein